MKLCDRGRTINQFVDEHEVVLYSLFVDLAEIRLGNGYEAIAVLEHECCIGVASGRYLDLEHLWLKHGQKGTYLVIATIYRLLTLTWKKLVEPSVTIGDRTSLFETTCIRNTSAIERLGEGGQQELEIHKECTYLRSVRYSLDIRT